MTEENWFLVLFHCKPVFSFFSFFPLLSHSKSWKRWQRERKREIKWRRERKREIRWQRERKRETRWRREQVPATLMRARRVPLRVFMFHFSFFSYFHFSFFIFFPFFFPWQSSQDDFSVTQHKVPLHEITSVSRGEEYAHRSSFFSLFFSLFFPSFFSLFFFFPPVTFCSPVFFSPVTLIFSRVSWPIFLWRKPTIETEIRHNLIEFCSYACVQTHVPPNA